MKKILFFLVFISSFLNAKTLVVDNNPECYWTLLVKVCFSCKNTLNPYTTIHDAINSANNGDTIEICPGTYNESVNINKNDLTIKGVDGQKPEDTEVKNDNDVFTIAAADITLKNMKIISNNGIGIYGNWNGIGEHIFEDLIVESKKSGIKIDHGNKQIFKNINITTNEEYGIYLSYNTQGAHKFENLNITSDKTSIYSNYGGVLFKNLNLTSNNGRGIDFDNSNADVNFTDINITSSDIGIHAGYGVIGAHILENLDINSTGGDGIYFENGFSKLTKSKITTEKKGIVLVPDQDTEISNINLHTNSDIGIQLNWSNSPQNITIKDSSISAGGDGIYTNNSHQILLDNLIIDGAKRGIYLPWNMKNIILQNSVIKNTSDFGLYLDADIATPAQILNNCFYGDREVKTNGWDDSHSHHFDGNYYDGVTDSNGNGYIDSEDSDKLEGYIKDFNYKESCHHNAIEAIINYRMDECSWDNDSNTYEIKNSGTLGNENNATSLNKANTIDDGKICRGGDIKSTESEDKALLIKNNFNLQEEYTLSVWIKFPLNLSGHKDFDSRRNRILYYFNIADRIGSTNDYIYFSYYKQGNRESWNLIVSDDNNNDSYSLNPQDLNGWHMLTFAVSTSGTDFYLDGNLKKTFTTHPNTSKLGLLFNSDYGADNDNEANGQSIGAVVDEFKIFNRDLNKNEIKFIYDNEKNGKNYDGNERNCINCNNLNQCFFDNFNRNELGDKWKIIKSKNYTPNIQNGKLYLTNNDNSISAGVSLIGKFPAKDNYVEIEFEENAYDDQGGEGADGVAIVLSDASINPVAGAFGGSLGYAQKKYGQSDCDDPNGCPGFAGGWLGIGLDEYGNFSNPTEGREGGPGRKPDSIAIRGKGDGLNGYEYIDGTESLSPGIDDNRNNDNENNNRYTSNSALHYKYKIIIDTRNNKTLIKIYRDTGEGYEKILETDASNNGEPPEYFKFSLTGSTGGANNYHNFDNIKISALNCGTIGEEETKNYKFDAWDTFRDETDRFISTKIVNKKFNLTLAEYNGSAYNDDFNGTVCSALFDEDSKNRISEWNATHWRNNDDINKTNISFKVTKAVKKAKVYIYWIENSYVSNDSCSGLFNHEGNETNSTDNFAIRPKCYRIDITPNPLRAGVSFDINVSTDSRPDEYNGTAKTEANITDNSKKCVNKDAKFTLTTINFNNGESKNSAKFDDVGIVDINISDKSWAGVDNNDTPKQCDEEGNGTYICVCQSDIDNLQNIKIVPHHFEINANYQDYDTDANFTYIDENLTLFSNLNINITAKNEQNETTENYNKECYAKNIDINISHNDANASRIIYRVKDKEGNIVEYDISKDENISFTYDKNNFTTDNNRSTSVDVYLNFDRNISKPVNPFEFNITKIDVNDSDSNGSLDFGKTARYYYGKLILSDIIATQNDFNKSYNFVLYDENESDNLKPDNSKEIEYHWYENFYHQKKDGNVSDSEIVVSSDYNASNAISGVDVSVDQDEKGVVTFKVSRSDSNVKFAVIHLLGPNLKWLWYSKFGDEYNISNDSTCLNHFCFTITWQNTHAPGEVGSGKFEGTESNVTDTNSTKRGVKIFR